MADEIEGRVRAVRVTLLLARLSHLQCDKVGK